MNALSVSDFAARCGGTAAGFSADAKISGFALDSRVVARGELFIAVRGQRADGHDFVKEALDRGAIGSLVERSVEGPHILVSDVVTALARFGASMRVMFPGPVVAVTGSAGKTTTKELIASSLSCRGPVLKSIGNRNTEYTSPLLWADRTPAHWAAVVELAMRGHGQIRHLTEVHRPNVGVVTNIGTAHVEMVGSRAGIAAAKGELLESLPSDGIAVLWQEDDYLGDLTARCACPYVTFGFSEWADCRVMGYRPLDWSRCVVRLSVQGATVETELPAIGRHLALDAAAALLVATRVGIDPASAAAAMRDVEMPKLRMQRVRFGGAEVLLDTYNANPAATIAAIQTICELPAAGRRLAVIGEMRELGAFEESGHRQVGRALAESGIERALLYGQATKFVVDEAIRAGFAMERMVQADSLEAVRAFLANLQPGDVVLIKGSRSLELESALPAEATAP